MVKGLGVQGLRFKGLENKTPGWYILLIFLPYYCGFPVWGCH